MSHLAIALAIVLSISIIIILLIVMHNNQIKARETSILSFFRNASTAHNLSLVILLTFLNVIIIEKGFTTSEKWYYLLLITLPLLILAATNFRRNRAG